MSNTNTKRKARIDPRALPVAKVEEMFDAWLKHSNMQTVARECGVHPNTVRKYVNEGDLARGIEPFREREQRITRLAARRVEKRITYARADATAAAWQHLQLLDDVIIEALLKFREQIDNSPMKLGDIVKAIKVSGELKTALERWSDDHAEKSGNKGQLPKVVAELTVEEMEAFAVTGALPENGAALSAAADPSHGGLSAGAAAADSTAAEAAEEPQSDDRVEGYDDSDEGLGEQQGPSQGLSGSDSEQQGDEQPLDGVEVLDAVPPWLEPEE